MVQQANGAQSNAITCWATINGEGAKLERSAAGLLIIALDDPNFDTFDVMINDQGVPGQVHFRLAHFVPTKLVSELKAVVEKAEGELKLELEQLLKARVIDTTVGFDATGLARAEFNQGERKLTAQCLQSK